MYIKPFEAPNTLVLEPPSLVCWLAWTEVGVKAAVAEEEARLKVPDLENICKTLEPYNEVISLTWSDVKVYRKALSSLTDPSLSVGPKWVKSEDLEPSRVLGWELVLAKNKRSSKNVTLAG